MSNSISRDRGRIVVPPPGFIDRRVELRDITFEEDAPVTLCLPKFWQNEAELWFTTIETIFELKGIRRESRKLEALIASLELRHIKNIEDLLNSQNANRSYARTKRALLDAYAASEDEKLDQLLHHTKLTSELRPTELL